MRLSGSQPASISLRGALGAVHGDRQWWLRCLGYGFAAATGLGLPLAAALTGATIALARPVFSGQAAVIAAGLWLTMAALVYAHLIVVQTYVAAEKEVQRREIGL